ANTMVFRERVVEARERLDNTRLFENVEETDEYKDEEDLLDVVKADPSELKLKVTTFGMFEDQLATVEQALEHAAKVTGSDKRSNNLSLICLDYLANSVSSKRKDEMTSFYLSKMEKTTGTRLIAVDPKANRVVYGLDALVALAGEEDGETTDNT
ncbi:MAG: hypothetical protein WBN88_15705, partial [Anderseniella sp.]